MKSISFSYVKPKFFSQKITVPLYTPPQHHTLLNSIADCLLSLPYLFSYSLSSLFIFVFLDLVMIQRVKLTIITCQTMVGRSIRKRLKGSESEDWRLR